MPRKQSPGKPTTRRYIPEEKAAAVRMVRALRAELGTEHGTVQRVARQSTTAWNPCAPGYARPTSMTGTRLGCRPQSRRGSRSSKGFAAPVGRAQNRQPSTVRIDASWLIAFPSEIRSASVCIALLWSLTRYRPAALSFDFEDDVKPASPSGLAHLHAVERSPNTVKAYAHDLRDWFEFLAQHAMALLMLLGGLRAMEVRGLRDLAPL